MDEIMHFIDTGVGRQVKPLTDEEKRICDLVLCGTSPPQAYREVYNITPADSKEYHKIASRAASFIKTVRAQRYMVAHRKKVRVIVEQDMEALAAHVYDIAMGNDMKTISHFDKDSGEWVNQEVPPSHTDQIAAAAWVKGWYDSRCKSKMLEATSEESRKQDEVRGKAEEFLAMFSGRSRIQDGIYKESGSMEEALDVREELMPDVPDEDTNPDVVRRMITSFTDGDEDIADKILVDYAERT